MKIKAPFIFQKKRIKLKDIQIFYWHSQKVLTATLSKPSPDAKINLTKIYFPLDTSNSMQETYVFIKTGGDLHKTSCQETFHNVKNHSFLYSFNLPNKINKQPKPKADEIKLKTK